MKTLIRNGNIVTATDNFIGDIYIEGEIVVAVGQNLPYAADRVIDATGKLVFPGGIDPHVHLDMPFMGTYSSDNYETGTCAALHGGTTMVIELANGYNGYLPTPQQHGWGGYETWRAKSSYLEVDASVKMIAAFKELFGELVGK